MVNAEGELIYVGKAKNLRARLMCYFRPKSRDPKAGRILEHARSIVWEFAATEFGALLRELELIQRWQPRFNVQGQPFRRRRTYVCIGRPPAPYVFLQRRPPADTVACFGPVPAVASAREAVRRLNDWFKLRDCAQSVPMLFADQGELFPMVRAAACLRHEIGTCLGPCAAACSQAGYAEQTNAVRAFLSGADLSMLDQLTREMNAASTATQFERATLLRDRLDTLRWLHHHLERLRFAQEHYSFVYPVRGPNRRTRWYLIHRGRVLSAQAEPRTIREWQFTQQRLAQIHVQDRVDERLSNDEVDVVLLVASWFRRHPEERLQTLSFKEVERRGREILASSVAMA